MAERIHWEKVVDENKICWLTLDRKGASVNSLNAEVLEELDALISEIDKEVGLCSVVITSGKQTGFIAGADIEQFKTLTSVDMAKELITQGAKVFDRLAALKLPTIASIKGFCLGGGLELALCCKYRIALEDDRTRIGLPEVKLGIHPGWGGTVRLPRLVGAPNALDLILSGRTLRAKQAAKMGVVDAAVPLRLFDQVVKEYALNPPSRKKLKGFKAWSNHGVVRLPLAYMVGRQLKSKAKRQHYPAPYAVIDNWVEHGVNGKRPFQVEIDSIGRLLVSDTAKNLLKVFYLQERLKSLAPKVNKQFNHVHVIGGGVMGGAIAAWCAMRKCTVSVQDPNGQSIAKTIASAHKLAKKRLKEPHLIMQMMDRLIPDPQGQCLQKTDIVIEAVSENCELKQKILADAVAKAPSDAVIATNTSTICIEEIAKALPDPTRLVGVHFFNPVALMPLVEVVIGEQTQQDVVDMALAFVKKIDKLPLPVKSAPGFLVNRILMPYMLEAVTLLEEGKSGEQIDAAAESFGMPMGPITLADTVGLDICKAALESMKDTIGADVPVGLLEKVEKGDLGAKTGRGYYEWKNGKITKQKSETTNVSSEIRDRLVLRMINEALACLREGIVSDAQLLNAGSIFGFGFPPFRGGVLNYLSDTGKDKLKHQLEEFSQKYGDRFRADPAWSKEELFV
ncbi:MAG: crotonase [Legionellales bacterium]|nr:crotonase [Legionellales bacterium]